MDELYAYMKSKLLEMYTDGGKKVTLDADHFRRLYRLTCEMLHICNIVMQDDDIWVLLRQVKGGGRGDE